jgi:hypothetical protein
MSGIVVLYAGLSVLAAAFGVVGLYELRLYTDDERAQASTLFRVHRLSLLVTVTIGLFVFVSAVAGHVNTVNRVLFFYVLYSPVPCYLGGRLGKQLDRDRSPLGQRFEEWWRHPSEG